MVIHMDIALPITDRWDQTQEMSEDYLQQYYDRFLEFHHWMGDRRIRIRFVGA